MDLAVVERAVPGGFGAWMVLVAGTRDTLATLTVHRAGERPRCVILTGVTSMELMGALHQGLSVADWPRIEWIAVNARKLAREWDHSRPLATANLDAAETSTLLHIAGDAFATRLQWDSKAQAAEALTRHRQDIETLHAVVMAHRFGAKIVVDAPDPQVQRRNEECARAVDVCFACSKLSAVRLWHCSRCGVAAYCDADCQKRHWPTHRITCKPKEEQR